MSKIIPAELSVQGRRASLSIPSLCKSKVQWICNALLDSFAVDDAYIDDDTSVIKMQNWHTTIDRDAVVGALMTYGEEAELDIQIS